MLFKVEKKIFSGNKHFDLSKTRTVNTKKSVKFWFQMDFPWKEKKFRVTFAEKTRYQFEENTRQGSSAIIGSKTLIKYDKCLENSIFILSVLEINALGSCCCCFFLSKITLKSNLKLIYVDFCAEQMFTISHLVQKVLIMWMGFFVTLCFQSIYNLAFRTAKFSFSFPDRKWIWYNYHWITISRRLKTD